MSTAAPTFQSLHKQFTDYAENLFPSSHIDNGYTHYQIVQYLCKAPSIPHAIALSLISFISQNTFLMPGLSKPLFIPGALVDKVCDNNNELRSKISWIAPVASIGIVTVASFALCSLISSIWIQALIYGAHAGIVGAFSAASKGETLGPIITLKSVAYQWLNLSATIEEIETKSDRLSCVAFVVAGIGLTILGFHPIVSTTAGYVTATLIKVVAMRHLTSV